MNRQTEISETPIYDHTRLDLSIDPQDQQGHDVRVAHILHKHPEKWSLCGVCGEAITLTKRGRRTTWTHADKALDKGHGAAWKDSRELPDR